MPSRAAHRLAAVIVLACVAAGSLAGCSALSTPITLTLGVTDGDDTYEATYAQHFADEISAISDGAITVEPEYHANEAPTDLGANQAVGARVGEGDLDLGLVPARAWDELGVTSLRALNTPFLITSDELTNEVASSAEVRARLLSGLPEAGVVGIDLLPDALRHPIGYGAPILGLEDYRGKLFQSPDSATIAAMFATFDADVTGGTNDPSTQVGMETAFNVTDAFFATGNVTYFPKFLTIVANADMHAGLSDGQRKMLTDAAARTREWVTDTRGTDADAAAAFCSIGGEISAVTPGQLAELEAAARPVSVELEQDSLTAGLIEDIAAMKEGSAEPDPITTCDGRVALTPDDEAAAINGVYQVTVTREELTAAGFTDETEIRKNAGTWTWTFRNGIAGYSLVGPGDFVDAGRGLHYTVDGGSFRLVWSADAGEWTAAAVVVQPDGSLVFTNILDSIPHLQIVSEVFFGLHPWVRVGDP